MTILKQEDLNIEEKYVKLASQLEGKKIEIIELIQELNELKLDKRIKLARLKKRLIEIERERLEVEARVRQKVASESLPGRVVRKYSKVTDAKNAVTAQLLVDSEYVSLQNEKYEKEHWRSVLSAQVDWVTLEVSAWQSLLEIEEV